MRFIGDASSHHPRTQLDVILRLQEAPEATPFTNLDELYLQLLLLTLTKYNPKFVVDRFQAVGGSIILLRNPLPLDALVRFVKYDDDNVSVILPQLQSVIIPPSRNDLHLRSTTLLSLTFLQTLRGAWILNLPSSLFPNKNVGTRFDASSSCHFFQMRHCQYRGSFAA
jgi:hypothetical protein